MIKRITRAEASRQLGTCLPYGLNWYLVTGLQWYPTYGDYSQTWACEDGLTAIIGKRKQSSARVTIQEGERVGEVERV